MDWIDAAIIVVKGVAIVGLVFGIVAYMTLAERKIAGFIQDRHGPNRVGPWGLLQPVADGLKILFKEDVMPERVDRFLFIIAPGIFFAVALSLYAVIPFGESFTIFGREISLTMADLNVGILFVLAVSSLGVYGILLGGWSSNSKFSLLGGFRSAAQLISYELAMGLAIVSVVMLTGTFRLAGVVDYQSHFWGGFLPAWNIFRQPLAFFIFLTCTLAETNRVPFDLPEAEQELVGGYHTEYSSFKFALYMFGEYCNVLAWTAITVLLFLGGWHFWGTDLVSGPLQSLVHLVIFIGKTLGLVFFFIWLRWTMPRFRFDQLMALGWKFLLPLGLANILLTGIALSL
ncbi:NADH-quinone oxidoreductase subunit NuoH [candidate division KSB1 bacterium]